MPKELEKSYLRAKRVSTVGAVAMFAIVVLQLFVLSIHLFAFASTKSASYPWAINFLLLIATTVATALLGRFLFRFSRDESPFNFKQFLRLVLAAGLFAVKMALDASRPAYAPLEVMEGTISLTPQPGLDLQSLTLVVFLACLAIVVRYGNALKEDSDSIA